MANKITGSGNIDNDLFTKLGNLETAINLTIEQMKNMNIELKDYNLRNIETQREVALISQRLITVDRHIEKHCNLLDGEDSLTLTVRDLKKAEDDRREERKEEQVDKKTEWSNLKVGLLIGLATLLGGFFFALIQLLIEKYYIRP